MHEHEIKASVILAKNIDSDTSTISDIIKILPSGEGNIIWMYLTLKTNLNDEEEIKVGFDLIKTDEENGFGIEIGEFVIGRTRDQEKKEKILKEPNRIPAEKFEVKEGKSIIPYNDIYTIGLKFPPLPELKPGSYEFIVYDKEDDNNILDTFQFKVE